MLNVSEKLAASLRRIKVQNGKDFQDLVDWLQASLHDQTVTNEQTLNTNTLLVGQGKSSCMREIVQVLIRE